MQETKEIGYFKEIRDFLHPSSIALIGASDEEHSIAGRTMKYAFKVGYAGRVIPVNPKQSMVMGIRTYEKIEAVPGRVELAVLLRPSSEVPALLEACGRKGVRFAVVIGAGFAEMGREGAQHQEALFRLARKFRIRVLGPNCMGFINLHGKVCTSFSSIMELSMIPGSVGIVSQSGAMGSVIMRRLQDAGVGTSYLISTGNEMDLDLAAFVDYLVDDGNTRIILAYLEAIRDGQRLLKAAKRAFGAGKPFVVFHIGKSSISKRIIASHTGNLAVSSDILRGGLRQKGALVCSDLEELVGTTAMLSLSFLPSWEGLGVIATSGGAAGLFADKAEEAGLALPPFSPATTREIASLLKFGTAQNPLDMTGQVVSDSSAFFKALDLIFQDDAIQIILIILTQLRGPVSQGILKYMGREDFKSQKLVVGLSAVGSLSDDNLSQLIETRRLMIFHSFGECARSIKAIIDYAAMRRNHAPGSYLQR